MFIEDMMMLHYSTVYAIWEYTNSCLCFFVIAYLAKRRQDTFWKISIAANVLYYVFQVVFVSLFSSCAVFLMQLIPWFLPGMWSQSRHLSLETYYLVSSRTKSSMSRSCLSLGPMRLRSLLSLGAICLGLGLLRLISGHHVSLRCFVQACAMHTVVAVRAILTNMTFVA